ncbi:transposon Ty3-I Gag-Pol polyprotein [Trichonephila clavipes]|nr:transposon Ty3-I Gag-Pol polyprotein [Trichonephila clavipes]
MHRTLKRILRVLCLEAMPDWEKILPQALFALRTVIHDSTGFSPTELVHGKNLRTPVMLLYEKLTEEEHVESNVVDYVFELINRMKRCQELAILHMEDAKEKQKLWYDRRTVKRQFQLGGLVWVIAPSRPNKLSVLWVGSGEIVQQLSETNYVVKFPEKDKTHVYHVNMLKPYHQREENISLLCINPLKHDEEEDIPSLELENERSGWSKIISDVQLNSKLSQIQRGQLKELLYEYSNLFSNIPGCTDLAEHDIELESERAIVLLSLIKRYRQLNISLILDLTRGYWQLPLSPRAQRYASFVTTFGTFKPLRLPFGLKNAPYYFSRLMANLLRNCEDFAVPYLDDIAIFSLTWDDHLKHLKDVFDRLRSAK